MRWRESTAQRRVMEAILEVGAEISRRNSSDKVHAAHDDSELACFRTRDPDRVRTYFPKVALVVP